MNNQTSYALLVRSKETSRDLMETAAYALCILSAIVAIWQFVEQSSRLSVDRLVSRPHSTTVVLQSTAESDLDARS